jgi:hypothetical protein
MATQPKRAHTCKLRIKKDTSFLRFISPDWSILDVIGQTILLKELTGHFGSFQKACVALNLQDNEVESFLLTYLEYQKASDRGRIVAEKWGRDQAVPANADADIPQQRPLLICAASIAPACGFLESLGYQAYTPAVQSWTHRIITWPPFIDVADFDVLKLNQANFNFPTARKKPKLFKYEGSLGDDTRAMVALVGASQPKTGGTPDTRISFIDLPDRSVAYGPRGSRQLYGAGRYYVCWSTDELSKKQYSDLLSTRNNAGSKELGNSPVRPHGLEGLRDISTKDTLSPLAQEGGWDAEVQAKDADEGSLVTHIAQAEDLTVDPKDIFRKDIADVYDYEDEFTVPFRREDEPEGPLRKIANSELQRLSSTWPDQMFQFRLPRGYTIIGPLGDLHTFDLPQHETRDEMGHPRGMGGTYHIVPPQPASKPLNFKLEVLPDHVALRLNVPEKMIIIRNGTALPRFVEPGVHEWSTREGFLDFYSAHGCYDILQAESDRDALQELSMNSLTPEAYQADSFIRPTDHGEKRKVNPSPIEEAQEVCMLEQYEHFMAWKSLTLDS